MAQIKQPVGPETTNWTLNSQVSGVAIQLRLHFSRSLKPCELQKPIPNHQSSFCWIYLPLDTVNHQILLSTLSSLGIAGIPLRWFESYLTDDPTVAARISGCLADISAWMKEHHLQLNLAKTELLVFPAAPTLQHDITIQLGSSTITPSTSVRNLGVIFDDQLTFKDHIAKTARSCRFALHNIRKIRPFLTEHAAQLLVQALVISRLDYCNALLAGLPSNTVKPLQMIQNAAARLVFKEPKRAHVTPLFISLHWLPIAARIKFKTLMLAHRTTTGSAPAYMHSLLRIYIPPEV
ncbi:uncharacterized protein LOC131522654 [Onychostoma macrolepis]|uniref:uncharacterized protein LOC131522654 n=1 Tax=Onychostoma macrolepis TaxID=369639 RepID=UPI002729A574|nr:uncharacterized protein LOC131522654 [Onychostoma macrolepis]